MANKVTYCYCNGDLCNSRPASSFRRDDEDDQSSYDASDAVAGDDEDELDEDDYRDVFSGQGKPTAPFSEGTGRPMDGSSSSSSWSTAAGKGLNANGQTPSFHHPATEMPAFSSSAGTSSSGFGRRTTADAKGLVPLLHWGAQLITALLCHILIRSAHWSSLSNGYGC